MAQQIPDVPRVAPALATPANLFITRRGTFVWLALLLVTLAILRSAISTRLDGFTIDEAYHIAAGVSYVKYHDFRINPEHPPLVKLWVGIVMYATGFRLDSLRQFHDKPGEVPLRILPFSEQDVSRLGSAARKSGNVRVERPFVARFGFRAANASLTQVFLSVLSFSSLSTRRSRRTCPLS